MYPVPPVINIFAISITKSTRARRLPHFQPIFSIPDYDKSSQCGFSGR